jgi:hypothetical protein
MKQFGKIIVCVVSCLGFSVMAGPGNVAQTNNPYTSITSRNVFDLSAPLPVANEIAASNEPLPKITVDGITSILGDWEVLFKVGEVNPAGAVVKEHFSILRQNETDDGIKVVSIDSDVGTVTFINHGTIQEIPLPKTTRLALEEPILSYGDTLPKSYPPAFIRARTPDYLGGGPDGISNGQPMTNAEDRAILIEAQRAYLKSNHDPAADALPPTALTPDDSFSSPETANNSKP